ncbi:hypothetical protein HDU76_002520 [Blyttiomyces sp. JEL0837]|nr:hypothetical protein HDU76_002520 [Blyttiomyces sp. JEL0837]
MTPSHQWKSRFKHQHHDALSVTEMAQSSCNNPLTCNYRPSIARIQRALRGNGGFGGGGVGANGEAGGVGAPEDLLAGAMAAGMLPHQDDNDAWGLENQLYNLMEDVDNEGGDAGSGYPGGVDVNGDDEDVDPVIVEALNRLVDGDGDEWEDEFRDLEEVREEGKVDLVDLLEGRLADVREEIWQVLGGRGDDARDGIYGERSLWLLEALYEMKEKERSSLDGDASEGQVMTDSDDNVEGTERVEDGDVSNDA